MQIAVAGATGRTGRLVVSLGLERGHTVKALVRRQAALDAAPGLEFIVGDIDDRHVLAELVRDSDVVISAIGPRPDRLDTCSVSTRHLIEAGAKRMIVVSGMAVTLPTDRKSPVDRFASMIVRLMAPKVFADKVAEIEILRASSIPWTAARVGMLLDGDRARSARASLKAPPGNSIDAGGLARFCLDEAENPRFIGRAPFVAA